LGGIFLISFKDLQDKYFYKKDLEGICRQLGLPITGTKLELHQRILFFLENEELRNDDVHIQPKKRRFNISALKEPISLEMPFIEKGLKFNQELRDFIAAHLGKKRVSFTKSMASAVRQAVQGDYDISVRELIAILCASPNDNSTPDDVSYQWNNFVRDFSRSAEAQRYENKLKVASILWGKVRDADGPKLYATSLLAEHDNLLREFEKSGH
jgi:hypothetical protein